MKTIKKLSKNEIIVVFLNFLFFLYIYFIGSSYITYNYIYLSYFLLKTLPFILIFTIIIKYNLYLFYKRLIEEERILKILLIFILYCYLSILWTKYKWIIVEGIIRNTIFISIIFLFLLIFYFYPILKKYILDIFIISLTIPSTLYILKTGYFYFYIPKYYFPVRFGYIFGNPSLGGAILGALVLICFIKFFLDNKFKFYYFILFIINFISLIITHNKWGNLLIVCFIFFIIISKFIKTKKGKDIFFIIFLFILSILFIIFLLLYYNNINKEVILKLIYPPLEIRLFIWKNTLKSIFNNIFRTIMGYGPSNFFPVFANHQSQLLHSAIYKSSNVRYAHFFYLELWLEYGIIGLFLFIFIIIEYIKLFIKNIKNTLIISEKINQIAIFLGGLYILLHGLFSISLSFPHIQMILGISIAYTISCNKNNNKNLKKEELKEEERINKLKVLYFFIIFIFLFIIWKYINLDELLFQIKYKKFSKIKQDNKKLTIIKENKLPFYENLYTLKWRLDIGIYLIDKNYLNNKYLKYFLDLEKIMPTFGDFYLYKAILYAKKNMINLSSAYFIKYASLNPFSLNLWIFWGICCKNRQGIIEDMIKCARYYYKIYPNNLEALFGLGIGYYLKKKYKLSKKIFILIKSKEKQYYQRDPQLFKYINFYIKKIK